MVPNIDGTMRQNKTLNIKMSVLFDIDGTEHTQHMEHSALFSIQQTETQLNPFKKMH